MKNAALGLNGIAQMAHFTGMLLDFGQRSHPLDTTMAGIDGISVTIPFLHIR